MNNERIGQSFVSPQPVRVGGAAVRPQAAKPGGFETVFQQQLQQPVQTLAFSGHALQRMQQRQIALTQSERQSILDAVDKAREKGSQEMLILAEKAAFVVSVRNNTVITVMDKENLKDNLFTKIDSAIII